MLFKNNVFLDVFLKLIDRKKLYRCIETRNRHVPQHHIWIDTFSRVTFFFYYDCGNLLPNSSQLSTPLGIHAQVSFFPFLWAWPDDCLLCFYTSHKHYILLIINIFEFVIIWMGTNSVVNGCCSLSPGN